MWLCLRQICLVARDSETVTQQLRRIFGLEVCHIDPNVAPTGRENRLFPSENQILEVAELGERNREVVGKCVIVMD